MPAAIFYLNWLDFQRDFDERPYSIVQFECKMGEKEEGGALKQAIII